MVNPLHLVLDSRAGLAATVLRLLPAVYLLHGGVALLAGHQSANGAPGVLPPLEWLSRATGEGWTAAVIFCLLGISFLSGFLTRGSCLILLAGTITQLTAFPAADASGGRELLLFSGICFALLVAGGGAWSVDRKISSYLLPDLGWG